MFHKIAFILLLFISLFFFPVKVHAAETVNVYLFWGSGCPHCVKEKIFLEKFKKEYPVKIYAYEVWYNPSNTDLLKKIRAELKTNVSAIPFTIIGENHITGYLNDETTGKEIKESVNFCLKNGCNDPVGHILGLANQASPETNRTPSSNKKLYQTEEASTDRKLNKAIPEKLSFPIIGDIRIKDVSLPVLTILIGGLDGFNPCAMWTLLFLLSLLMGMHDKKRMWILGGTFIAASAGVYYLFMAAWLHLILFIGFIFWVRLGIGLLGLGGGIYNLREYLINKDSGCKVTNYNERQKIFGWAKRVTKEKHFWLAIGGIILLAAAVNIIEIICSAGLPVLFTQILAMSNLTVWQYYLYLLLYIFIFMLDDLFVFILTMKTLELTGVTTKYSRLSHLIGGILMVIIGILLIFKPELLMFG